MNITKEIHSFPFLHSNPVHPWIMGDLILSTHFGCISFTREDASHALQPSQLYPVRRAITALHGLPPPPYAIICGPTFYNVGCAIVSECNHPLMVWVPFGRERGRVGGGGGGPEKLVSAAVAPTSNSGADTVEAGSRSARSLSLTFCCAGGCVGEGGSSLTRSTWIYWIISPWYARSQGYRG